MALTHTYNSPTASLLDAYPASHHKAAAHNQTCATHNQPPVAGRSTGLEWIPANRSDPPGPDASPVLDGPSILAAVEGELRRLGTDYIDVLYLHWPDRWVGSFKARTLLQVAACGVQG